MSQPPKAAFHAGDGPPSGARLARGVAAGMTAALIWGSYFAFARTGIVGGLDPADFALLRFGPAAVVMLPFLLRRGVRNLGGVGWRRGILLALCAGPVFIMLSAGAYRFTPLAHGAAIQPSAVTLASLVLAWLALGEAVSASRLLGIAAILGGLAVLAAGDSQGAQPGAWRGDLMFAVAGVIWTGYSVLIRQWRIDPTTATAVVAVLAGAVTIPLHLALGGGDRLLALGPGLLAIQLVVQGLLNGVVAVFAYSQAVMLLGVARASVFAALVPALAIVAGIPIAGEWPSFFQLVGAALVTVGMVGALGFLGRRGAPRAGDRRPVPLDGTAP